MSVNRETSLREYRRRINSVLDHLQSHLGDDHTLDELASIACFSPWHFHRIFTAVTGETLHAWIKRTRVEVAADRLRYDPDKPITTVAYELGFSSPSVLNRAFRDRYGCTPTQWRQRGFDWERSEVRNEDQASRNQQQAPDSADRHHDRVHFTDPSERIEIMSSIQVQDLPAYRIAYLRRTGPYDHDGIGVLWQELGCWAGPRGLMNPPNPTFGVSHDNPEVTPPEKCRYDACVAIPDDLEPDGPVTVTRLPAGKYAVLHVRCLPQEIGDRFADVFQWLTASGWQPDQRPCYQRYGADCEPDPQTFAMTCDICVPVKPL